MDGSLCELPIDHVINKSVNELIDSGKRFTIKLPSNELEENEDIVEV